MALPIPALGNLRFALARDIPGIGVVATAGFYYSPQFAEERESHSQWPQATFLSCEKKYADPIRDPERHVSVVEDTFEPEESATTNATTRPDDTYNEPSPNESVIVAVASWKLQSASGRTGQFNNISDVNNTDWTKFTGGQERDRNHEHLDQLSGELDKVESK